MKPAEPNLDKYVGLDQWDCEMGSTDSVNIQTLKLKTKAITAVLLGWTFSLSMQKFFFFCHTGSFCITD